MPCKSLGMPSRRLPARPMRQRHSISALFFLRWDQETKRAHRRSQLQGCRRRPSIRQVRLLCNNSYSDLRREKV